MPHIGTYVYLGTYMPQNYMYLPTLPTLLADRPSLQLKRNYTMYPYLNFGSS